MTMNAEQDYNKMSWLYNALYGEMPIERLRQLDYVKNHSELLLSYDKKHLSILDSACGNGVQATALALNGYQVTATDISSEMVKLTRESAKKHRVEINTAVKAWCELPATFKEQFNIVFCTGNSIVHSANADERKINWDSLVQVLKTQGTLVVETRNWDKIIMEDKRFTVYDKIRYKDKEYIPLYHWRMNGMEHEAEVEILFQEIDGDNHVRLYESSLRFTPFRYIDLLDAMRSLGLEIIQDTFDKECDWYQIYGRKP